MRETSNFTLGELLVVRTWECEGLESPWGFRMEALSDRTDLSGAQFRSLTRRSSARVKLWDGELCVVLRVHAREHPAIDTFCEVLLRGMRLGVHTRFLHSQQ